MSPVEGTFLPSMVWQYDPMQIRWSDVGRWIHFAVRADRLLGDRSASKCDSQAAQKS